MLVPDLKNFDNYTDFLNDFFRLNKESNSNFSYEYFARRIQWPKSALADAISGRRNLSVRRAIEFTNFLNMDALDTEIFIFWAIKKDNDLPENVTKLFTHHQVSSNKVVANQAPETTTEVGSQIFCAVHAFLLHTNTRPSTKHIIENLPFIPNLTEQQVEDCLNVLEKHGAIVKNDDGNYSILDKKFYIYSKRSKNLEPSIISSLKTAIQFYKSSRANTKSRSFAHFSTIRLKRSKFDEIKRKLADLMEWMQQYDEVTDGEDYKDFQIFQINSLIYPLIEVEYQREE